MSNYHNIGFTQSRIKDGIQYSTQTNHPHEAASCITIVIGFSMLLPCIIVAFTTGFDSQTSWTIVGASVLLFLAILIWVLRRTSRDVTLILSLDKTGFRVELEGFPGRTKTYKPGDIRRFYVMDYGDSADRPYRYELNLETMPYEDIAICQKSAALLKEISQVAASFNAQMGIETDHLIEQPMEIVNSEVMSQALARKLAREK